jgi:hypothetical protein
MRRDTPVRLTSPLRARKALGALRRVLLHFQRLAEFSCPPTGLASAIDPNGRGISI